MLVFAGRDREEGEMRGVDVAAVLLGAGDGEGETGGGGGGGEEGHGGEEEGEWPHVGLLVEVARMGRLHENQNIRGAAEGCFRWQWW